MNKRIYRTAALCCAHLSLVQGLMLLTFYITDRYNTAMAFINHDMTKTLAAILSVLVMGVSAWLIVAGGLQGCKILRIIVGGLAGLASLTALSLLVLDHSMISRFEQGLSTQPPLLFTDPRVKLALAVLAVTAVLAGLWLIVTDRKAAPVEETK